MLLLYLLAIIIWDLCYHSLLHLNIHQFTSLYIRQNCIYFHKLSCGNGNRQNSQVISPETLSCTPTTLVIGIFYVYFKGSANMPSLLSLTSSPITTLQFSSYLSIFYFCSYALLWISVLVRNRSILNIIKIILLNKLIFLIDFLDILYVSLNLLT